MLHAQLISAELSFPRIGVSAETRYNRLIRRQPLDCLSQAIKSFA